MIFNLRAGNLVAGYDHVRHLEQNLPSLWRNRLLAAYAHHRQAYDHRANIFKRVFVGGPVSAIVLFTAGILAKFWVDEPVSILLGLSSTAIAMLLASATSVTHTNHRTDAIAMAQSITQRVSQSCCHRIRN